MLTRGMCSTTALDRQGKGARKMNVHFTTVYTSLHSPCVLVEGGGSTAVACIRDLCSLALQILCGCVSPRFSRCIRTAFWFSVLSAAPEISFSPLFNAESLSGRNSICFDVSYVSDAGERLQIQTAVSCGHGIFYVGLRSYF